MYTILACALISAVAVQLICPKHDILKPAWLFGAAIGGAVGTIVAMFIGNFVPHHWVEQDSHQLANMHTTESASGAFIFGTGSIRQETCYKVLKVNDNGSLSPFSVRADNRNVEIVEDESLVNKGWLKTKAFKADRQCKLYNWSLSSNESPEGQYLYEFTVPKGTVRHEFNVN